MKQNAEQFSLQEQQEQEPAVSLHDALPICLPTTLLFVRADRVGVAPMTEGGVQCCSSGSTGGLVVVVVVGVPCRLPRGVPSRDKHSDRLCMDSRFSRP